MSNKSFSTCADVILEARNITHKFSKHGKILPDSVFENINLKVNRGGTIGIVGKSGSGKTTLLNILSGLSLPYSGEVFFDEKLFKSMDELALSKLRNYDMGFVFQSHYLLPDFNTCENIAMPLIIRGKDYLDSISTAKNLMISMDMKKLIDRSVSELSGGEKQRVSIARSIITKPKIIFADEPTGNLDLSTSKDIFSQLLFLQKNTNCALVIVSHDPMIIDKIEICYKLVDKNLIRI